MNAAASSAPLLREEDEAPHPIFATTKRWEMRRFGCEDAAYEGAVPAPWWPEDNSHGQRQSGSGKQKGQ